MKKIIVILAVLGVAAVVVGWWNILHYLSTPAGGEHEISLTIKRGMSLGDVTNQLDQAKIIKHPRWLYYYARVRGLTDIKVGDYRLTSKMKPKEILNKMLKGDVQLISITVPEGFNSFEIAARLAKKSITAKQAFIKTCQDKGFLKQLKINSPSCEGYLFPETYRFARNTPPKQVIEKMMRQFHAAFSEKIIKQGAHLGLTESDIVTLASIIQKETGAEKEMPHISSVFHNRLKKGMRLQTDPTVIYVEWLKYGEFNKHIKNITRSDLRRKHPYNTYTTGGLPPGPIASPGKKALRAAVNPLKTDDLYFVSKNNGEHVFCPNLHCHNRAVYKWQIEYFRKKRKK